MLVRPISTSSRVNDKRRTYDAATILDDEKKGVFRVLQIGRAKDEERKWRKRGRQQAPPPPRSASMTPDQSWGSVWPAPRTFHPATVPLPVRQGVVQTKAQVVPAKYANAELMKIPNFLHLTPPVISTHCSAISKFCTAWPKGLETEEDIDKHFPVTITTCDHLNSNSSIRDRRARIVQLRLKVDSLPLDTHARDKMVRLVGDRFEKSFQWASTTNKLKSSMRVKEELLTSLVQRGDNSISCLERQRFVPIFAAVEKDLQQSPGLVSLQVPSDHYFPVDEGSESTEDGRDDYSSVENKEVSIIVTAAAAASISLSGSDNDEQEEDQTQDVIIVDDNNSEDPVTGVYRVMRGKTGHILCF